jgi:hypothetical protein
MSSNVRYRSRSLLNHFVGADKQRRRNNRKIQRFIGATTPIQHQVFAQELTRYAQNRGERSSFRQALPARRQTCAASAS